MIYLPTVQPPSTSNNPSPAVLHSFAAPLSNIHDSHVTAPWFGPNAWTCIIQPVPGGGIPSSDAAGIELTLTFKEGGAYDFHTRMSELKERLAQMRELYGVAQEVGGDGQNQGADLHLEQLPAYEEVGNVSSIPVPGYAVGNGATNGPVREPSRPEQEQEQEQQRTPDIQPQAPAPSPTPPATRAQRPRLAAPQPDEPPPGYEETQQTQQEDVLASLGRVQMQDRRGDTT